MIVANEQVEHAVARSSSHGLDDLLGDGGDARIPYGDSIEGLKVVDQVEGAALLRHCEPV